MFLQLRELVSLVTCPSPTMKIKRIVVDNVHNVRHNVRYTIRLFIETSKSYHHPQLKLGASKGMPAQEGKSPDGFGSLGSRRQPT